MKGDISERGGQAFTDIWSAGERARGREQDGRLRRRARIHFLRARLDEALPLRPDRESWVVADPRPAWERTAQREWADIVDARRRVDAHELRMLEDLERESDA